MKSIRIGIMSKGRWKKSKLFTLEKFEKEILRKELPGMEEVRRKEQNVSLPTLFDYLFRRGKVVAYSKEMLNRGYFTGRNAQALEITLELETQIDEV